MRELDFLRVRFVLRLAGGAQTQRPAPSELPEPSPPPSPEPNALLRSLRPKDSVRHHSRLAGG